MFEVRFEPAFIKDYERERRLHPKIGQLLRNAGECLIETGTVPDEYRPHRLENPDLNYLDHMEFHLDDDIDVLVIFSPHHSQPIIRLVRMRSHERLFHGRRR